MCLSQIVVQVLALVLRSINVISIYPFIYFWKDIVETHPGLEFLREASDFHSRYIHTVRWLCFHIINIWSVTFGTSLVISVNELTMCSFVFVFQVIARIFYCVNSSWTGRITIPELRNSNFLEVSTVEHQTLTIAFKGKLSREAHALASCKNLKSVRLTLSAPWGSPLTSKIVWR